MHDPHVQPILLEICIASVEDALAAQGGGADRVELNTALALSGLTPSLGTLLEVRRCVNLPVIVMLRPRAGGFAYSDADFRVMQRDLGLALDHGADGFAFGILTDTGEVDLPRCRQLVKQMGSKEGVFHRAFDVTPEPFTALEQLVDFGVRRVMTSGHEATALQGAPLIAALIDRAGDRIEILPAGGINRATVEAILTRTGCKQVHASLKTRRSERSLAANPRVSFGTSNSLPCEVFEATDPVAVAEISALLGKGRMEPRPGA